MTTVYATLENDLEMLEKGFEFEAGELDWYLKEDSISEELKNQLRAAKEEYGI